MRTKRQIRNFILKTLLPYKEDRNNCGWNGTGCEYLTREGKKCAVGVWMKKGEWQNSSTYVGRLFDKFKENEILLKPARDMGFSYKEWSLLQVYHDNIALGKDVDTLNGNVSDLENAFGITLEELRF